MARTVRNFKIDTRSARLKLEQRREPFWTVLSDGCAIGYRRGVKGGSWVAKFRGEDGSRQHVTIGPADDATDADGVSVFSYAQAQTAAREWLLKQARIEAGMEEETGPYSVADAMRDYLTEYVGRKSPSAAALANMRSRVDSFILPAFGTKEVARLTTRAIRSWMNQIAETPPRARTGRFAREKNFRNVDMSDPDVRRGRRHTANKILAILKAGLNLAWKEGRVSSDAAWRRVSPFPKVSAPLIRYFADDEVIRLVHACAPDFRRLVQGALFTGARYGELATMMVSDLDRDNRSVFIRDSKTRKPRHAILTEEATRFFLEHAAGKTGADLMFTREDGTAWAKNHQQRPMIQACAGARIEPAAGFHVLRHTHGSRLAMRGVPMAVIAAQLGHSDTRMTEKHYAHLAPSYVADTIRASFGTMGILEPSNVEDLSARRNS